MRVALSTPLQKERSQRNRLRREGGGMLNPPPPPPPPPPSPVVTKKSIYAEGGGGNNDMKPTLQKMPFFRGQENTITEKKT